MTQHSWMNDRTDVIKPSANGVEEIARWMPTGVKHFLLRTSPGQHLTGPTPILDWLEQKDLISRPRMGTYAGQIILSPLGQKLHKSLQRRMAGQEGN